MTLGKWVSQLQFLSVTEKAAFLVDLHSQERVDNQFLWCWALRCDRHRIISLVHIMMIKVIRCENFAIYYLYSREEEILTVLCGVGFSTTLKNYRLTLYKIIGIKYFTIWEYETEIKCSNAVILFFKNNLVCQ